MEVLEEPDEERLDGDFWVVYGEVWTYYVSAATAREVARRIGGWWTPRWVTFLDVSGSRIRMRTQDIRGIHESTELQRARVRAFQRARLREDNADRRPWEED